MLIIRLVLLAVLLYVAWRLLRGITGGSGNKNRVKDREKTSKGAPSRDTLVEDPVCHTLVPKNQAIRLRKDGETYYFCSEKCCDTFSGKGRGEE